MRQASRAGGMGFVLRARPCDWRESLGRCMQAHVLEAHERHPGDGNNAASGRVRIGDNYELRHRPERRLTLHARGGKVPCRVGEIERDQ